jgi:hypothetical protein
LAGTGAPGEKRLTVLQEKVALFVAAFAIGSLISKVSRNSELFNSLRGHLAGQNPVDVAELGPCIITGNIARLELAIIWRS